MKNERTSKAVASIAGRILRKLKDVPDSYEIAGARGFRNQEFFDLDPICTVGELKSALGSALTQRPDRGVLDLHKVRTEQQAAHAVIEKAYALNRKKPARKVR